MLRGYNGSYNKKVKIMYEMLLGFIAGSVHQESEYQKIKKYYMSHPYLLFEDIFLLFSSANELDISDAYRPAFRELVAYAFIYAASLDIDNAKALLDTLINQVFHVAPSNTNNSDPIASRSYLISIIVGIDEQCDAPLFAKISHALFENKECEYVCRFFSTIVWGFEALEKDSLGVSPRLSSKFSTLYTQYNAAKVARAVRSPHWCSIYSQGGSVSLSDLEKSSVAVGQSSTKQRVCRVPSQSDRSSLFGFIGREFDPTVFAPTPRPEPWVFEPDSDSDPDSDKDLQQALLLSLSTPSLK